MELWLIIERVYFVFEGFFWVLGGIDIDLSISKNVLVSLRKLGVIIVEFGGIGLGRGSVVELVVR